MPKPKKEDKKEASPTTNEAKATTANEPSRVGSSHNSESGRQGEKDGEKHGETARYASITGTSTPPQQLTEMSEKA